MISDILKNCQGSMLFSQEESFIILVPGSKEGDFSSSKSKDLFFSDLQHALVDTTKDNYYIGVGSEVAELKELKQSYQEACSAVHLLQNTGKKGIMFFMKWAFINYFQISRIVNI